MSRFIWKFAVDHDDVCTIAMPVGAQILYVQAQDNRPCIWALVDPKADRIDRHFVVVATGQPLRYENLEYLGTFQWGGVTLVFHLFELMKAKP